MTRTDSATTPSPAPAPAPAPDRTDTEVLVRARNVSRTFGDVVAVDDVSLEIRAGSMVGLLGPNGAGKSTLISMFCGQRRPTTGSVQILGGDPRDAATRVRLGTTPQETGLPESLKVAEVLRFVAAQFPDPMDPDYILDRFELAEKAKSQTGGLSGGQKRRLALALAVVGRPELVLLDEPTTGLDVEARRGVWSLIRDYHTAGGTVVLSSHNMAEVEELAQRVVVINRGRVVADDTATAIRTRVATRRVRFSASQIPEITHIERDNSDGDRHELWTADSDAVVRELVTSGVAFSDLEVVSASLEEAFVDLTREGAAA